MIYLEKFKIFESKYDEQVLIIIDKDSKSCYLKSKFHDSELNRKLLSKIVSKFNLGKSNIGKYKIPKEIYDDLISFLKELNLKHTTSNNKIVISGRITLKEIKK